MADKVGYSAAWIVTYISLAYVYVIGFYLLGESARRIRLLIELDAAGERGMTLEEIRNVYSASVILRARLGRLVAGGQLLERDGRYYMGRPGMLLIAKGMVALKVLVLGTTSEFRSVSAPTDRFAGRDA